jgi:hypothetical protein
MRRATIMLAAAGVTAAAAATPCTSRSTCAEWAENELNLASLPAPLAALVRRGADALVSGLPEASWDAAAASSSWDAATASSSSSSSSSSYCPSNAAWEWVPFAVAAVSPPPSSPTTVTWDGTGCFGTVTATTTYTATGAVVVLRGINATTVPCLDSYIVSTSLSVSVPVELSILNSVQNVTLGPWGADEAADVALNGLGVHAIPCGLVGSLVSLVATVGLFVGNETDVAAANADFLSTRGVWQDPLEPFGHFQEMDKTLIRSGDYLAILKLDGLDPLIAWGTGKGATGHSALAVWRTEEGKNRTLYICEATDKDPFGPAYFPPPYGIIVHTWDEWMPLALAASYHVALLPLAKPIADAFNETAFWAWFETVQGQPYGYPNFLYSVLDTSSPWMSLPLPLDIRTVTPVLNIADAVLGQTGEVTIYTMFTQALNVRLGTSCTTLACVIVELNRRKAAGQHPSDLAEATAIPELDSTRYGGNVSFVCSAFAARGWIEALPPGVLAPFAATEQTPRDNFMMAIYDKTRFTSHNCPVGITWADDSPVSAGPFCQLMGPFVMPLNGYNTVEVYANVNQDCGSQWPGYERCVESPAPCQC